MVAFSRFSRSGSAAAATAAAVAVLVLAATANADPLYEITDFTRGNDRTSRVKTVEYKVTFTNKWNAEDHPFDYPRSAHWSWPVVAAHNVRYEMWAEGRMASEGVVKVAETGSFSTLAMEINQADKDILNYRNGNEQRNDQTTSQIITGLCVDQQHPFVSTITMIAPSPDWFSGVPGLLLSYRGRWYDKVEVDVWPWDAGSDSGSAFASRNDATDPREVISSFPTVEANSPFVSDVSGSLVVRPVASFKFERVKNTSSACLDLSAEKREGAENLSPIIRMWGRRRNRISFKTCRYWAASDPRGRCPMVIRGDGEHSGMLVKDVCREECFAFSD